MKVIFSIAMLFLLGACGDRLVVNPVALPPLVEYSPEFQAEVSSELEACGDAECEATAEMISDYGNLRTAIREAKKLKGSSK